MQFLKMDQEVRNEEALLDPITAACSPLDPPNVLLNERLKGRKLQSKPHQNVNALPDLIGVLVMWRRRIPPVGLIKTSFY